MTIDAPHLQTEQLSALLDQQLSPAEQSRAEQHLVACSRCEEELESLRATVSLVRRLPQVEPPRDFGLPATTLRSVARQSRLLRLVPWTRAAGALAAALFVVLMSADLLAGAGGGEPVVAPVSEPRPAFAPAAESRGAAGSPTAAVNPVDAAQPAPQAAPSADGAALQGSPAQNKAAAAAPFGTAPPAAVPARPAPAFAPTPPAPAARAAPPPPLATPAPVPTPAPAPTSLPVAAPALPPARPGSPVATLRGWQIASGLLALGFFLTAVLLARLAQRIR
jgi:hypothetical protein